MIAPVFLATALLLQPSTKAAPPAPPVVATPDESTVKYLEIPIKGEFGKEVTAPGIRDALRAAKGRKAAAVVFTFDSPGGRVADAEAIAAVIDKERVIDGGSGGAGGAGELKCYAVITRAISACVWPLSRCDRVFFTPGAAAGAAVVFHLANKTGNAEVDSKLNAALAAEVSSAAEAHAQPGAVYRAMMLKEARLFGWKDAKGAYHVGESRPDAKGLSDIEEIDTDATVLAWTTQQAVKYGFGTMLPSSQLSALGTLIGATGWQDLGDAGKQSMSKGLHEVERKAADTERAKDAAIQARKQVVQVAERIEAAVKAAEGADPGKLTVKYKGAGVLTPESQLQWQQQTDRAMSMWNSVLALTSELENAQRRASKSVDDYSSALSREYQARLYTEKAERVKVDPVDVGIDVSELRRTCNQAVSTLSANRMRNHI